MSTVFHAGDVVRLTMLPSNYGGSIEELQALIGRELPIERVDRDGHIYILKLDEPVTLAGSLFSILPVEHRWVEAIATAEEIK